MGRGSSLTWAIGFKVQRFKVGPGPWCVMRGAWEACSRRRRASGYSRHGGIRRGEAGLGWDFRFEQGAECGVWRKKVQFTGFAT